MRFAPAPVLLLAALAANPATGAPAWRCTAGAATAYRYDPPRQRWETLVIPVAGQQFRVVPDPDGWSLFRDGDDAPLARCTGTGTGLRCGDGFTLDRATLVFESRLFTPPADRGELTATTVTGRCQPLRNEESFDDP